MSLTAGDEFSKAATPDQALLLKLAALASAGSGAVMTVATENANDPSRHAAAVDGVFDLFIQQQREEQIRILNDCLAELDRCSEEQLRAAQERLADILSTANKAKDGRTVFADENGTIYDERGNTVAADEIDWSRWRSGAPSWAQLNTGVQNVESAKANIERVQAVRDKLANDPSDETLKAAADDIAAMETTMAGGIAGSSPIKQPELRSTSAAKLYDGNPGKRPLTPMFGGLVSPAAAADPPKRGTSGPGFSPS
jgi:hypothetical protein